VSKEPYNIFLSHAYRDRDVLKQVRKRLAKEFADRNVEFFDDAKLTISANFRDEIRKAIEDASQFVVFWSPRAAESAFVNYETGMAEALGKPILVIVPKGDQSTVPDNLADNRVLELEDVS
jgi:hypothetical protein